MTITSLSELRQYGTLQNGDVVRFANIPGFRALDYLILESHASANGAFNHIIFQALNINPQPFCSMAYGYSAGSGDWPKYKTGDYEALTRCIAALYEEIDRRNSGIFTQIYPGNVGVMIASGGSFTVDPPHEEDKKKEKKKKEKKKKEEKPKTPSIQDLLSKLIITEEKKEEILCAISQVDHQAKVFDEWGFGETLEKGKSTSMLFYGIPGTGKTLAAEIIAKALGKKLKIVGPAEIQSSEPGAAERTLQAIFKNAVKANELLLFDECDSLICDRAEVGIILAGQINTLLQALERFEGVCIFTTNRILKLDPAMERRISVKIEFTFPELPERKKIYQAIIPKKAPICEKVDLETLASVPLTGGSIKNVVLGAARKAAYKKKDKIEYEDFLQVVSTELQSAEDFGVRHFDVPNAKKVLLSLYETLCLPLPKGLQNAPPGADLWTQQITREFGIAEEVLRSKSTPTKPKADFGMTDGATLSRRGPSSRLVKDTSDSKRKRVVEVDIEKLDKLIK